MVPGAMLFFVHVGNELRVKREEGKGKSGNELKEKSEKGRVGRGNELKEKRENELKGKREKRRAETS
jgi:hypothetical protein